MENQNQENALVCPTHKTAYLGMLLLGVLVGGGVACAYFLQVAVVGSVSYKAGFDTARKLVEDSPMGAIYKIPDDIRNISGVVTKIEGSRVTVKSGSQNPFTDKALLERVVIVAKDTQITKVSHAGEAEFRVQMEAFIKNSEPGKEATRMLPPMPPEPTRTTVAISSIAVGDTVSVGSVENIKDKKEFTASAIEIF